MRPVHRSRFRASAEPSAKGFGVAEWRAGECGWRLGEANGCHERFQVGWAELVADRRTCAANIPSAAAASGRWQTAMRWIGWKDGGDGILRTRARR